MHKEYNVLWFVRYNINDGATMRKKSAMWIASAGSIGVYIKLSNP